MLYTAPFKALDLKRNPGATSPDPSTAYKNNKSLGVQTVLVCINSGPPPPPSANFWIRQ